MTSRETAAFPGATRADTIGGMVRRIAVKPPSTRDNRPRGSASVAKADATDLAHASWRQALSAAWLIAGLTLAVTLATLGPTANGPGLTVDEFYDAAAGKRLVCSWRTAGWQFFEREQIEQAYGALTLHPPLGRWIVGWVHHVVDAYPGDSSFVWLPGARAASAVALAVLVGMVGSTAALLCPGEQRTWAAGGGAAATALMPRLFAEGHLVSLDLFEALFFFAAVAALLLAARATAPKNGAPKNGDATLISKSISKRAASPFWFAVAGVVWGLALATKISGLLLLPAAGVWLVWRFRRKGLALVALWALAGYVVLFVLWPWLWFAPLERTAKFLLTATERATLHTFYWGEVWDDRAVPWHYPWIITSVTVPIGLLALAVCGAVGGWRDATQRPAVQLVLLAVASVLLTFSMPGVPVYDGERLFLMDYPLIALLAGIGLTVVLRTRWLAERTAVVKGAALGGLLALQGLGVVAYHPFQLSYYNSLVGGLRGAERLGFEVTYWGDTVDHAIAETAAGRAAGGAVFLAPHLAPFQAQGVEIVNPAFETHGAHVVGWPGEAQQGPRPRYLLVYHRRADVVVPEELLARARLLAENRRQGVWLARLYELPQ
ncbi:MAG: hypothetical protein K2Y37_04630 [Pirellulales bacterium]|nr:hypothetical protein [Pirellulales bacterium]